MQGKTLESGFREVQHTADWALEVWAPDLPALFVQAALGMNWLMGVQINKVQLIKRSLHLNAVDPESLLVGYLNGILYEMELDSVGFDTFVVKIEDLSLEAGLQGGRLVGLQKAIKAVTFHDLEIKRGENGVRTTIVFDV